MNGYATNSSRAALGLLTGVLTGACLVTLWDLVGTSEPTPDLVGRAMIFIGAAVVWAGGLAAFATLPWFFLDHYGLRGWPVAVVLGAVLSFLVVFIFMTNGLGAYVASGGFSAADNAGPTWVDGRLTPHGWAVAFMISAICGGMGGVVGLAVWRVAYRRADNDVRA